MFLVRKVIVDWLVVLIRHLWIEFWQGVAFEFLSLIAIVSRGDFMLDC